MTIYHLDMKVKSLSRVQLFATPWTVAHHAPLFVGSSGRSTEVGCHFLLQRIILTQGSNPDLPHCKQDALLFEPPVKSSFSYLEPVCCSIFHVHFSLLLPDLHADFSKGRPGGLVFPYLKNFPQTMEEWFKK